MPTTEELRAALTVAELEDELLAAKASDGGASAELKEQVREARRVYRELRQGTPPAAGNGDAVARPDAVAATGKVND